VIRVAALTLALGLPAVLAGQTEPPSKTAPRRPAASPRVPGDTIAKRDTLPAFAPPDSVMAALLARTGFTVTRYEGEVVTFDADTKALGIAASGTHPAMVEREGLRVRTDSMIVYSDTRQNVNVSGRYEIVPGSGQQPISGAGTVLYDVGARSGRLTNAMVTVNDESSERWFITSKIGKTALGDSARKIPPRFYGLAGTLTSCDDSIPDYHFAMREIKRTERNLVARPAVLYIKDIPVMWLPFVFQDIRPGRRSGILPPRLGISDIVRNNPNYRRHIENIGYYWAMSDYTDFGAWADWRSAAGGNNEFDPGWWKLNAESKYRWNSRFLQGQFAFAYQKENTGSTNHSLSWRHSQQFGKDRSFRADANYTSSTRLQRRNTFDPVQAMGNIRSSMTYQDKIGPASLTIGASQTQFPGRTQIERTLPQVSLTTSPLSLGKVATWTPRFEFTESASLKIDQTLPFPTRLVTGPSGVVRVDSLRPDSRDRTIVVASPITVFGYQIDNTFTIRDGLKGYPEELTFYPEADSARKELRIYPQTYQTAIDWNPTFTLPVPSVLQSRFKIQPSVSLQNVDGGKPFWVRNQFTGGKYVHQAKRLTYGVSTSPTIFGLFPGFGPFQRFRHTLSPTISYQYAPAQSVSREYLEAISQSYQVYLGAYAQNSISFGLNQNIEAKVRSSGDSAGGMKTNPKVLTMSLTPLSYDFERARVTGRKLAGITTEQLGFSMRSELIPGFDLNLGYSLFEGSTQTDTARFDPQLTTISSRVSLSRSENPFTVLTRLFGRAVPDRSPDPQAPFGQDSAETAFNRQVASRPVAGQGSRGTQFLLAPSNGWEVTLNLSSSRPRKLRGDRILIVDSRVFCKQYLDAGQPFVYEQCLARPVDQPPPQTAGGAAYQMPNQTSMQGDFRFAMTQHWSASWNTSYDFELSKFAAHTVSLQRDLHDWRAIFAFTHSPNGNFAFNFFIALKPQPDLKFDYSKATIRSR
jgi:hypothetical protein